MPEQVRCPSCEAKLRVPDSLLGASVKCPKCQTTFTAEVDGPAEPEEGIAREPAPSAGSRRRSLPPEDMEEEAPPPDDEFEEEDRPRRRRRRRRFGSANVESQLSGPAIALMIVGIIDILIALLRFVAPVLGISLALADSGRRGGPNADDMAGIMINVFLGFLTLVLGGLIILGSVKMKNVQSYGLAMTACILAMIPCINCCILGLPFGIWGLVVLNKPEVKEAFSR